MKWLLSNPLARPLARRWYRHRDGRIVAGVGAGLWFNAGAGDLDFNLGCYEPPVQTALAAHLQPGDTFYDIGANLGFFSVLAARLVGEHGRVYAFEPVPENARLIAHNARRNNFEQITVLEKAVSNVTGAGELRQAHHVGGSALSTVAPPPDVKGMIPVALVTIDELVTEGVCLPPSLVKIDVEGAELEVLQGMEQTIRRQRPLILYEIDDGDAAAYATKMAACAAFLQARGYETRPLAAAYPDIAWHVGHVLALPQ